MLQAFQARTGTISQQVEQLIEAAQTTPQKLSAEQLEKVLLAAMPQQQKTIQQCKKIALCYHPDGTNLGFLTQILDLQIEKIDRVVENSRQPPVRVDPLTVKLSMAPDAKYLLLFNARDVDENGRPLLMKVVAREGFDPKTLDLSIYRTQANNQPDVQTVPANVDFVEVNDEHESEFNFGDPVKVVSLNNKGDELSATVKVNPRNVHTTKTYRPDSPNRDRLLRTETSEGRDAIPVAFFMKRLKFDLALSVDPWSTTLQPEYFKAELRLDRGFVFEPGSWAHVSVLDGAVSTGVSEADAQLLGSPATNNSVELVRASKFANILNADVVVRTRGAGDAPNAQSVNTFKLRDLLYTDARQTTLAGLAVEGFSERGLRFEDASAAGINASKSPIANDPDGQKISLQLPEGLLKSNGASVDGYKMVVGYVGPDGKFIEVARQVIDNAQSSRAMAVSFDIDDSKPFNLNNGQLQVRTFLPSGVPGDLISISYRDIPWASASPGQAPIL
jgi:hypothetical protein